MIFALMRNGHEVIRGLMRDLSVCDTNENIAPVWSTFQKWQHVHALMEDGNNGVTGMFAKLDQVIPYTHTHLYTKFPYPHFIGVRARGSLVT